MSDAVVAARSAPSVVRAADMWAKASLLLLLVLAVLYPDSGNMRDKAGALRAVLYPMLSFAIPLLWWSLRRDRASFPWLPDLMVTLTCFTDILGNRMNLYDTVVWFDDWMHFMNTGLLAGAVVLLTLHRSSSLLSVVERALAFGATAAIAWELGEYVAFISRSTERRFAYTDTLGDLGLGVIGALVAAVLVHRFWQRGALSQVEPLAPPRSRT